MPTTITDALALAGIAALVLLCRVFWHAGTWLPGLIEQVTKTKLLSRQVVVSDQAVAAAEERARSEGQRGEAKLSLASELVSRIDPTLAQVPPPELLQASVARLRQSSSSGLTPVMLSTPPAGSSINVVVTSSSEPPPPPLPAPAKVPLWREEAPTNPQVRR